MKRLIHIMLLLAGLAATAQTNQPLPSGSKPISNILYLAPDSTVWTGSEFDGLFVKVAKWNSVDSLFKLGYTRAQVDSAITANTVQKWSQDRWTGTNVTSATAGTILPTGGIVSSYNSQSWLTGGAFNQYGGLMHIKGDYRPGLGFDRQSIQFQWGNGHGGTTPRLAFRTEYTPSGGIYSNWAELWHSGNFTPPDLSDYYAKSGGTISGSVLIDNTVVTPLIVQRTGATSQVNIGFTTPAGTNYLGVDASDILRYGNSANTMNNNIVYHSGNLVGFTRAVNGLVPSPGGSGTTRYLREDGSWAVPSGGGGGGTATDLSIQNRTSTTLQVGSSTGAAATMPIATTTLGGLMTAADKTKLDGLTGDYLPLSGGTLTGRVTSALGATLAGLGNVLFSQYHIQDLSNNTNDWFGWSVRAQAIGGTHTHAGAIGFIGTSVNNSNGNNGMDFAIYKRTGDGNSQIFRVSSAGTVVTPSHGNSSEWAAAYGWGNHATVGYAISGTGGTQVRTNTQLDARYLQQANFTWSNLSGKPSTFTPSAHTHSASDINSGTFPTARIADGAITHAKYQSISQSTILGRVASGSGAPTALTAAQVRTMLNVADGAQANVPTNIAQGTRTATTVQITSSTGTNATLSAATSSQAGVLTAADKTKLDALVMNVVKVDTPWYVSPQTMGPGTYATTTQGVVGAKVGDIVVASHDGTGPQAGFTARGYVSAPGIVTMFLVNTTGSTVSMGQTIAVNTAVIVF